MKNDERLFVHLWSYGSNQDYWLPYETTEEPAAQQHVTWWRDLHPCHDGEVLHAKLSEV